MNTTLTIFKGLQARQLDLLKQRARKLELNPGDAAVGQNDTGKCIYLVMTGQLRRETGSALHGTRSVKRFRAGDVFVDDSFIMTKPAALSVVATEPSTLLRIDSAAIKALEPELQLYFNKKILAAARTCVETAHQRETELVSLTGILMTQVFQQATRHIPAIESSAFIKEVIRKVPRLPVFAISLAGKLLDDDISSREIAQEVKKDPSLAGMILKTINSSYHGMAHRVSDLHDAIVLLGFNTVSQITIAEGLRRSLPDSPLFRQIHDHSQAVSYISYEIANRFDLGRPSEISTISILHDIGQIVLQLLKMKNPGVKTLFDLVDSARMGAMLLKSWGLPERICETVKYQTYPWFARPEKIPGPARTPVTILFVSHMCHDHFCGKKPQDLSRRFFPAYLKAAGIQPVNLAKFAHEHVFKGLDKKAKFLPDSLVKELRAYSLKQSDNRAAKR